MEKDLNRYLSKDTQIANKYTERFSISLVIREMHIKITRRNKFIKVVGYRTNTKKSVITINNKKNLRNNPFIIALQRVKYLEINSTKEVKDLHTENYKTFLKEIRFK